MRELLIVTIANINTHARIADLSIMVVVGAYADHTLHRSPGESPVGDRYQSAPVYQAHVSGAFCPKTTDLAASDAGFAAGIIE